MIGTALRPNKRIFLAIAILCFLLLLPAWAGPVWLRIAIYTSWMAYLCTAWHITGRCGLFAMAHSVFIGLGAYTSSLLWMYFGVNPWLGMLAGAIACAALALAVSFSCFRADLPVLGFGIFTLGLSLIAQYAVATVPIGGSTEGLMIRYVGADPFRFQFEDAPPFYYTILVLLAIVLLVSWRLEQSKFGIYFRAIRDDDRLAAAAGVNVVGVKLFAMALSAFFTGIGGTFWAQYYRFIGPEAVGPNMAITIILLVVVGGIGTLWGPVVGALLLVPLAEYLRQTIMIPGAHQIIYGATVVAVLLTLRQGVVPWVQSRYAQRQRHRQAASLATAVAKASPVASPALEAD